MDNGYLAYTCVPVETEIEGDSIDVEMRINEGRQFDINKVIVTGNDRTRAMSTKHTASKPCKHSRLVPR